MNEKGSELVAQDILGISTGLQRSQMEARQDLHALRRNDLEALIGQMIRLRPSQYLPVVDVPALRVLGIRLQSELEPKEMDLVLGEALRTWIIASSRLDESVAFIVESDGTRVGIWFAAESIDEEAEPAARLQASFPGVVFGAGTGVESARELVASYEEASIITGIPRLERNETRQYFSIDRLVRGMRGRPFALAVLGRPLSTFDLQKKIDQVREARSHNHERIRRNITKEIGESRAKTIGISGGPNIGLGASPVASWPRIWTGLQNLLPWTNPAYGLLQGINGGAFAAPFYSVTNTQSQSISGSLERLDAFAEAYDAALLEEEQRIKLGLTEGGWDSACYIFGRTQRDVATASALWVRELIGDYEPLEPLRTLPVGKAGEDPRHLPIPVAHGSSRDIPLHTVMTSSELASLMSLPKEQHSGIDVRRTPRFTVDVPVYREVKRGSISLGLIKDRDTVLSDRCFYLSQEDLRSHTLVAGITGSGKSTTVKTILGQISVPFLVVEPAKAEYRGILVGENPIRVYTAGQETVSPFRLNPFELPEDGNLGSHMDSLSAIINAVFPMEGPMSAIVEQGVTRAYSLKGWDIETGIHPQIPVGEKVCEAYPTMADFYNAVDDLVAEQGLQGDYGANVRGALLTRIRSLCVGARGLLFNTCNSLDVGDLVSRPTVIELRHLGSDETKTFLIGLILLRLYRYFEHVSEQNGTDGLKCVVVVEEAHRLFRKTQDRSGSLLTSNTSFKSLEIFENIMAEARAYGFGLVIVDQLPLRLSEGALKNTNTKIAHRLSAREDAIEVGGAMGLGPDDAAFLNQLRVGDTLLHRADMERPAHLRIRRDSELGQTRRCDKEISDHSVLAGYSMAEIRPPDFYQLMLVLEQVCPGSLLDIGDRLVFSLFVGDIEMVQIAWDKACEEIFDLCKQRGYGAEAKTIHSLSEHAGRIALRRRSYLSENPVLIEKAMASWRSCFSLHDGWRVNPDGVVGLRRFLESVGSVKSESLPNWDGFRSDEYRRYSVEARNHVLSVLVDIGSGASHSPTNEDELIEVTKKSLESRLLIRAGGPNLAGYAVCFMILLAFQVGLANDEQPPEKAVTRIHEYYAKSERDYP